MLIYDAPERELEKLCEELEIDMNHLKPKSFTQKVRVMNTKSLAYHYKVCERTILNWKKRCGFSTRPENEIDYEKMDLLIKADRTTKEIMAEMGCVKSTVNQRKHKLGLGRKPRMDSPAIPIEIREPVLPPDVIFDRGLKHKARVLGQPLEWMRTVWLNGMAGQQWRAQLG